LLGVVIVKTVIITHYWKNSDGGGMKTYLTNIVDELKKNKNLDVKVIYKEGKDPENYSIKGDGLFFSIRSFLALGKIKPDAIYSQGTWYCLLAGYMYKSVHNVLLVHTFHTEPTEKLHFLGKIFFQTIINKCEYTTFVSEELQRKNEQILKLKFNRSLITYGGVNLPNDVHREEIEDFYNAYKIKKNSIILLATGLTALSYKAEGAKLLIKAVHRLKNKYPNILLILMREGNYSNQLKKLVEEEKLQNNVLFTGTVDNPQIPLAICNIYTHTPLGEGGVSLAILEAMAMGKPIIATSVGGIPEAIKDGVNGILVEPNENKIAEQIDYLISNKEIAQKLGKEAKKSAIERFTWKKTADKYIDLYIDSNLHLKT
jgi:glycosyltransferase involved in cell wall biosynthesis